MDSDLLNYLIYPNLTGAVLVPLLIGWVVARLAGSAGLAIGIGFPVGYALTTGLPPLPTLASDQKVIYLVLAGAALGLLLALVRAGLVWIAWRPLAAATPTMLLSLAALWLAAGAVGVAAIAPFAGSTSLLLPCIALATAVWEANMANWGRPRAAFGTTALLAGGGGVYFLATVAVLYADARAVALALLLPCFWADRLAPTARGVWPPRAAMAGIVAVPVLVAVATAYAELYLSASG